MNNRRKFLQQTGVLGLAALSGSISACRPLMAEEEAVALPIPETKNLFFEISLAEWSLHRTIWGGELDHLDFPRFAREKFGIKAVEYVSTMFGTDGTETAYLGQLKQNCESEGVRSLIIMVDAEGSLATADETARLQAVDNHQKWVNAAQFLGCHSIRVNAAGKGPRENVLAAAVDSLGRLSELCAGAGINVVVENHGGYSSDASWLSEVMRQVNQANCGTLPDFGNFLINLFPYRRYDPYEGMEELMPFAFGVSAKSRDFGKDGQDQRVDFYRMLEIVKKHGYSGHIGIEYEGYKLSEMAGIRATQALLIQAGSQLEA